MMISIWFNDTIVIKKQGNNALERRPVWCFTIWAWSACLCRREAASKKPRTYKYQCPIGSAVFISQHESHESLTRQVSPNVWVSHVYLNCPQDPHDSPWFSVDGLTCNIHTSSLYKIAHRKKLQTRWLSTTRNTQIPVYYRNCCWFQPIWNILVKLDHFPKIGVNMKKYLKPLRVECSFFP